MQSFESAYPQVGILMSGGSALPGTASTAGIRLGRLPGVSISTAVRGAWVSLPGLQAPPTANAASWWDDEVQTLAPALSLDAATEVFGGFSVAPTLGGVGSVEVMAGVTWMPFELFDVEGLGQGNPLGYGGGVRVGVLRESFTAPAVAVSIGYRRADDVQVGDTCDEAGPKSILCDQPGDQYAGFGQAAFDVAAWSTRATVAKRLAGVGLTGGIGYDRFSAEGEVSFLRVSELRREGFQGSYASDDSRWSLFGGASVPLLVGSVTLEAGWMQGGDGIEGYGPWQPIGGLPEQVPEHDPAEGTFFGSLSGRIHL